MVFFILPLSGRPTWKTPNSIARSERPAEWCDQSDKDTSRGFHQLIQSGVAGGASGKTGGPN